MFWRILTLLVVYVLALVSSAAVLRHEWQAWLVHSHIWSFGASFALSALLLWRYMPQASFYATFRHELCHWLFAFLSFNRPHALHIGDNSGGYYSYMGKGNYCITLSPYFFPITSLALLLVSVLFANSSAWFYILMGLALAFDLVVMIKDYHPRQSDWQRYGKGFSVAFSLAMAWLCLHTVLVLLLSPSYMAYLGRMWTIARTYVL